MTRTTSLVFACVLLAGCATSMGVYEFDNSRDFEASESEVWDAVMDYFTGNNIQIKTVERDSGIVYAERLYASQEELNLVADCGSNIFQASQLPSASFNVFVVDRNDNAETRVTVNTEFVDVYTDLWAGGTGRKRCNSRGVLEKAILDHIERY